MTYSIARDAETGELGVAVQSQAFNSGAAVAWARPGVGAVATQSFTDRRYGWRSLELFAGGAAPADALGKLRAPDELEEFRQVAFLSADGRTEQCAGARCVPAAGVAGDGWAAQGNMLASNAVWERWGRRSPRRRGSSRLGSCWPWRRRRPREGLARLRRRGDRRRAATDEPWERVVDLRVEDGDESLAELRAAARAGALAYRATNRATEGRAALGTELGLPERHVRLLAFEDAVEEGRYEHADVLLAGLVAEEPRWLDTFVTVNALPGEEALARFLAQRPLVGDELRADLELRPLESDLERVHDPS